jgi:hypothetical protein
MWKQFPKTFLFKCLSGATWRGVSPYQRRFSGSIPVELFFLHLGNKCQKVKPDPKGGSNDPNRNIEIQKACHTANVGDWLRRCLSLSVRPKEGKRVNSLIKRCLSPYVIPARNRSK